MTALDQAMSVKTMREVCIVYLKQECAVHSLSVSETVNANLVTFVMIDYSANQDVQMIPHVLQINYVKD